MIAIQDVWTESMKGVASFGSIKCPRNYTLKPGHNPFKIIPNPSLKNVSNANIAYLNRELKSNLKKWIYARDRQGNKIQDFRSFNQPLVSKAYIIEHVYDPIDSICSRQCKGRCLRGIGKVDTKSIKRLSPCR